MKLLLLCVSLTCPLARLPALAVDTPVDRGWQQSRGTQAQQEGARSKPTSKPASKPAPKQPSQDKKKPGAKSSSPPAKVRQLAPGTAFDYASKAFYPKRWKKGGHTAPMIPWVGQEVCLVTRDASLDRAAVSEFVHHLDRGWALYREVTGFRPRPFKRHDGRPTIVALPASNLSCGYGCGYLGAEGIEMIEFYRRHLPGIQRRADAVPHAYFYEMGRNYFGFGDRHSRFRTGFAVFMRYVCIDTLGTFDGDVRTRRTIERAIQLWEAPDVKLSFVAGFTDQGGLGEKAPRLRDKSGRAIQPSDQPVLYASLMLRLMKQNGGLPFVKKFYQQVFRLPKIPGRGRAEARRQCVGILVAASIAAGKDLTVEFCDRYRLRLSKDQRRILGSIDFRQSGLGAASVLKTVEGR